MWVIGIHARILSTGLVQVLLNFRVFPHYCGASESFFLLPGMYDPDYMQWTVWHCLGMLKSVLGCSIQVILIYF